MTRRRRIIRLLDRFAALLFGANLQVREQLPQAVVDAGIDEWAREKNHAWGPYMSDELFQYSEGKVTIGGTMVTDDFRIELTQDTKPVYDATLTPYVNTAQASATLMFDGFAYERWLASTSGAPTEALYTVEMSYSLDPYSRRVKGWRQRLRKLRDCFVDDVRFMLGRRRLTHLSMTIPDVRFSPPR